jgi:hypothetical protein
MWYAIAAVPGMTADCAAAIWLYTCPSPLYRNLNAALRSSDRASLKKEYFPYLRLLIHGLLMVRARDGGHKEMVNRGVKLDLVSSNLDGYVKGETLVWWQLSSITADISVLSIFLGATGDRTIFQILTSHAVNISAFSALASEAEMLLIPGTPLKITGILKKDASGLTIISCVDHPNAPPLLS